MIGWFKNQEENFRYQNVIKKQPNITHPFETLQLHFLFIETMTVRTVRNSIWTNTYPLEHTATQRTYTQQFDSVTNK